MCTAKEPFDAIVESCWHGVLFTSWKVCSASAYEEAANRLPTSHLFWLMRLGFLNGLSMVEERKAHEISHSPKSTESNMLMVGNPEELGKAIFAIQDDEEQHRVNQIEENPAECLGEIWDLLPEDSRDHLRDAEYSILHRRRKDASLDYANAVEVAISEWLAKPKHQRDWPQGLGDWMNRIRKMTLPKERRDGLDSVLRNHFDAKYAAQLSEALQIFQRGRLSRAHPEHRPPLTRKAQEKALGNEQNPSVFELLLKFAKRWR